MSTETIVSPGNIQNELDRIWESLETKNKMRASLFNLIVYTKHGHREKYFRGVMEQMIEKYPSRIIFVTIDPNPAEHYLKASVSIMTASSKESSEFACDFIQLNASKSEEQKIPFVILPHIIPDLPVYLVWADDPVGDNPLSEHIEKFSTRIIFDSESTDDLHAFFSAILLHKNRSQCDIADLNWARMENWRQLFSSTFRHQERITDLAQTKELKITYNCSPTEFFCHNKIQAIYFQGWLASCLNWKFEKSEKEQERILIDYSYDKLPLTIELIPEEHPELAPGAISRIELMTREGKHYEFERKKEFTNHIRIGISTKETCEMPTQFIFAKAQSEHSLIKEITRRGTSDHYFRLLKFIIDADMRIL
jgi:Glucose-6-phosphate dehydrogenase subunit N-terminal domain/Glucose-6-phosphate dehydrogenase subunit C-terminal domain